MLYSLTHTLLAQQLCSNSYRYETEIPNLWDCVVTATKRPIYRIHLNRFCATLFHNMLDQIDFANPTNFVRLLFSGSPGWYILVPLKHDTIKFIVHTFWNNQCNSIRIGTLHLPQQAELHRDLSTSKSENWLKENTLIFNATIHMLCTHEN